jgi:large repetitive protein
VTFVDNGDGTATISGKPGPGTAGVYNLTIAASNGVGAPAVEPLELTVDEASSPSGSPQNTFSITSPDSTSFRVGSRGTFSVTTTGDPPVALAETGALPAGVTFVDNGDGTAKLSGKPAKGTEGLYNLSITASSIDGPPAAQAFTLTVDEAPLITSAPKTTFTVGTAGSFTFTTSSSALPADPTLSKAGALPPGITFTDHHNGTATISGVARAGRLGVYRLMVKASNGVAPDARQAFSLTLRRNAGTAPRPQAVGGQRGRVRLR